MNLAVGTSAVLVMLGTTRNNGVMAAFPESVVAVMDSTVDPCDDFSSTHATNAVIKDVIEEGKPLLTGLWESCMDIDTLNALGNKPLQNTLEKIQAVISKEELFAVAGKLGLGSQRFMTKLDINADDVNTSTNVVFVEIAPLTLKSVYYDQSTFAGIETDSRKYISTVMNLSRYQDFVNRSALNAEDVVIGLEMKLENTTHSEAISDSNPYPWLPLDEALHSYPLGFGQVAHASGIMNSSAMTSDSKINFSSGDFDVIEDIIQETDLEDLKLYLAYVYVDSSSKVLSNQFYQAQFDLKGTALAGRRNISPRTDVCLGVETTNLPELVGKYYIQKMLDTKLEEDVDRIVQLIKINTLEDRMNKLEWLDASTRREAKAKLAKVTELIGGPKNEKSYPFTLDSKTYFENVDTIRLNSWNTKLKQIGQSVDKSVWMGVAAATANNTYHVTYRNQIVLSAAGLQSPRSNGSFHAAQNFGGIGAIVGHELTHGFDSSGRLFDGDGNRANWWSEKSSEHFEKQAQCFSDQYNGFAVEGNNGTILGYVDGNYTIGENIADNGGLNLAFGAYRTYMQNASVSKDSQLTTSEGEQLYFIAYGQLLCDKWDDGSMKTFLATNSHSPAKVRVNGAVMNSPDFGHVFKCKVGTKMNPRDKCQLW